MFEELVDLFEVSSFAVQPVYIQAGCLLATVAAGAFTLARYREYRHCRYVLMRELIELYSMGMFHRWTYFASNTSIVMADLMEAMATTRSRWYVLHLVLRALRRTPLRDLMLDALHANTARPLTGLDGLKALFVSAF